LGQIFWLRTALEEAAEDIAQDGESKLENTTFIRSFTWTPGIQNEVQQQSNIGLSPSYQNLP